jgi:hypothetical protein
MSNLIMKETKNTPYVLCDERGNVIIEGRSFPEDPMEFFEPIVDWIKKFQGDNFSMHIKLEYFNTSTCKYLLTLLQIVIRKVDREHLSVNWYYEEDDEDTLEIGQHYNRALRSQFNFIEFNHDERRILSTTVQ